MNRFSLFHLSKTVACVVLHCVTCKKVVCVASRVFITTKPDAFMAGTVAIAPCDCVLLSLSLFT